MIPSYILRRYVAPGGARLKKPPSMEIAGVCPVCHLNVINKKCMDRWQLDGTRVDEQVYHWTCKYNNNYYGERSWRQDPPTKVPKGNLDDAEYRYWIGVPAEMGIVATCRACRTRTWNPEERQAHFRAEAFKVGGDQCTTRLTNAYKVLLNTMRVCLVCKKERYGKQKWGVPLCGSIECETKWKFGEEGWAWLAVELDKQLKKANFIERRGLKVLPPRVEGRPFCNLCVMYMDDIRHTQMHIDKTMMSDGYYRD